MLRALLAHPLTRGLDVDDPRTTALRRHIIRDKPFLQKLYEDWYRTIAAALPPVPGGVLELGSGAGFLAEFIPNLITSEVFLCPGIAVVLDARKLPFADASLRAIVMTDVLHHIPDAEAFFKEADRVLAPEGRIVLIEPWNTTWSRFVYTRLHSEPFRPDVSAWLFPASGPLSGANGAMPWIILARDHARFAARFPRLALRRIELMMPFRYLASGGVSMRSLSPGWTYCLWSALERLLAPFNRVLAMFALIVIERRA